MPLEPGSRLGRIRIDALLGTGAMGDVYRGFDERLERPVAVREVRAERRTAATIRTRFLREARALAELDHPNLCRTYEVLERPEADYLILELIDGETLRERMRRGVDQAEALRIGLAIAQALAAAHARGLVHRDLKSGNVLLARTGEVKVVDFALAPFAGDAAARGRATAAFRAVSLDGPDPEPDEPEVPLDDDHPPAEHLTSTIRYMSPEQARGHRVTAAGNLYSLGILLFELLTGHHPYGDPLSTSSLLATARQGQIDWPADLALPPLLRRLTAPDPAHRPTAPEVVTALQAG